MSSTARVTHQRRQDLLYACVDLAPAKDTRYAHGRFVHLDAGHGRWNGRGSNTNGAPGQDGWSLDVWANTYIVPDSENYLQPTVAADRDWLHLEARFNYEDRDTGSIWLGYNFSFGEEVALEITPMVGAVIGNTAGIAPGYKASLRWRMVDLYSETEYVVDRRIGRQLSLHLVGIRTGADGLGPLRPGRAAHEGLSIGVRHPAWLLRGLLLPAREMAAYVFDPDASPTVVIAISVGF